MPVASKKGRTISTDSVSLNRAAKALGESRQTVLERAVARDFVAEKVAGRTVIARKSLNRLLVRLGRPTV